MGWHWGGASGAAAAGWWQRLKAESICVDEAVPENTASLPRGSQRGPSVHFVLRLLWPPSGSQSFLRSCANLSGGPGGTPHEARHILLAI